MSRSPIVVAERISILITTVVMVGCEREDPGAVSGTDFATYAFEAETRVDGYAADLVPIGWIGPSPSDVIAVVQIQDRRVRLFDSLGVEVGAVGQQGEGPGEFMRPVQAGWLSDDLWVNDVQLDRVTVFSPGLEVIRTIRVPSIAVPRSEDREQLPDFPFVTPFALYDDEAMLVSSQVASGDERAESLGISSAYLKINATGEIQNVVISMAPDRSSVSEPLPNGGYVAATVPFFPSRMRAVAPNGVLVGLLTTEVTGPGGGSFQVHVIDGDGTEVFGRVFPFDGDPIPQAVVDSVIRARSSGGPDPAVGARLMEQARPLIPAVYPPVEGFFLGTDGRVWIGLRATAEGNPWMVLSPGGDLVATAIAPSGSSLRAASDRRVWAVEQDEFDVESIVQYRIERID
jgi:hypothetical protein